MELLPAVWPAPVSWSSVSHPHRPQPSGANSPLTRQTSHAALPLGSENGGKPTPIQKRIPTRLLLPQVLHSDPWGLPEREPQGGCGGTDGIVKPGPCAMTRGVKIIPDLAPRAWPEASCSALCPTQKPTRGPTRRKLQARTPLSSTPGAQMLVIQEFSRDS